ncbi:MAG TPA: PcfJ domain-containing protein [Gemmataceae bacterium]|jgi:hypothetical protein|nr:PcfJ domain-containing protein [Gemmataceae bacterium]
MRSTGLFRQNAKRLLDDSIHAGRVLAGCREGGLQAYERLLWNVQSRTTLLHPSDRAKGSRNFHNLGLLALTLHHADWLRPIESTITELLTSKALFLEGRAMRHCVATYVKFCASRLSSIWSMQMENQTGLHRVLTIEVDLSHKTICQVRGKCNRPAQAAEREIMERWAGQEGLKVSELACR